MIRKALHRVAAVLGSARFALGLILFAVAWSIVATMVPQTDASAQQAATWAVAHPGLEAAVRLLGLHAAFTAPVFIVCVLALGVSTAVCAWRRTRVAMARARTLRRASHTDRDGLVESTPLRIACDPAMSEPQVLSAAAAALDELGIRTERRGDLIASVSSPWTVWGSVLFHWALVALALVVLLGGLQRSSGLMGVAVGQTKADAPASYGVLQGAPLRDWNSIRRSFRVDSFVLDYRLGGVDYGPTPIVSVLDAQGRAVKTQRVYPNDPLQLGSLTIHTSAFGLAAVLSQVTTSGAQLGTGVQLIDFSQTSPGGTTSAGYLVISDASGHPELKVSTTVPLSRAGGQYAESLPATPTARLTVTTLDGRPVSDTVVRPGEEVRLPVGGALRLTAVTWYARLSVVDDGTIPLLYVVLAVGMAGLVLTVFARQQLLLVAAVGGRDGGRDLAVDARLWRNAVTTRDEVVRALSAAVGAAQTREGAGMDAPCEEEEDES